MRKVAVCGFKGGVGKTTVAVNAAVGLARAGRKVLLIDTDAQGSATDALGVDGTATPGTYGLLVNGDRPQDVAIELEARLDVIPATRALAPIDQWLTMQTRREEVLRRRMTHLRGKYDVVLLDTPPAFSLLTLNALVYADEVWLPVSMEYMALQGVKQVMDTITMIGEELDHGVTVRYVIPTFYDKRNSKTAAVMDALAEGFGMAVTSPIRINVRLSEAPSYHQSIFDFAPTSTGAQDFTDLVRRIKKDG